MKYIILFRAFLFLFSLKKREILYVLFPIRLKRNKGVIILEYVLLLVACVATATVINEAFEIGSEASNSGWIIKLWWSILKMIAEDI